MCGPIQLVISRNGTFLRVYPLVDALEIGRNVNDGIRFDDPCVSRRHARIELSDSRWVICDMGSLNGTLVNGQRIGQAVVICEQDHIGIGPFELTVCQSDQVDQIIRTLQDLTERDFHRTTVEVAANSRMPLTQSQRRVYEKLVEGMCEKEIAVALRISVNTAHHHVQAVYKALGVSSHLELMALQNSSDS